MEVSGVRCQVSGKNKEAETLVEVDVSVKIKVGGKRCIRI